MADGGIHGGVVDMKDTNSIPTIEEERGLRFSPFFEKFIAEVFGTYFLIFVGCGSEVVDKNNQNRVTLPGIAVVWGLLVMVLVYTLRHISGAHFNPVVTMAYAISRRFPLELVPAYVFAQLLGSTLAAGTLRLLFTGTHDQFAGTQPSGSDVQAFVVEFIITFYLLFVRFGVATDDRAIGEFAGLAVGATIGLNVMFAGPITGASMNPARSLGPAVASNQYKGIWIYLLAPTLGGILGSSVYNTIRFTDKPLCKAVQSS